MSTTQRTTTASKYTSNASSNFRVIDGDYLRVHSAVGTPPPGFVRSKNSSESLYGQDRADPAKSAPPPPGFSQKMNPQNARTSSDSGSVDVNGITDRLQMINPNMHHPEGLLLPSDFCPGSTSEGSDKIRSKSYVNLAVALGEGLAESMGDSLFDGRRNWKKTDNLGNLSLSPGRGGNRDGNSTNAASYHRFSQSTSKNMGLDNIARQTRHSLSRVTGRSTENSPSIVDGNGAYSAYHIGQDDNRTMLQAGTNSYPFLQSTLPTQVDRFNNACIPQKFSLLNTGVGCIVEEPRSRATSPNPQQFCLGKEPSNSGPDHLTEAPQRLLHLNNDHMGRASAPPKAVGRQPKEVGASPISHYRASPSLQQHKPEMREFQQIPKAQDVKGMPPNEVTNKNAVSTYANTAPMYTTQFETPSHPNSNIQQIERMENDRKTQEELVPFLWDVVDAPRNQSNSNPPSRALAIMGASSLLISEVRSTCEAFGSLLYFRPEFCRNRGVILFAYHDMRSARHAAKELNSYLQRLVAPNSNHPQHLYQENVKVMYCVNLNSSSAINESMLKLSNLPLGVDDKSVNELIASYGAVRSIHFEAEEAMGGENGASYTVEFYDIQDANQALLEIQGMTPWGPGVMISQIDRSLQERTQGRDLLSLIGRWRRGETHVPNAQTTVLQIPSSSPPPASIATSQTPIQTVLHSNSQSPGTQSSSNLTSQSLDNASRGTFNSGQCVSEVPPHVIPYPPTAQLVIGPDGQYSYVMMSPHAYAPPPQYPQNVPMLPPMQQVQHHFVPGPQGAYMTSPAYNGQNYYIPPMQPHLPAPSQLPQYHHSPSVPVMPGHPCVHGPHSPVYGHPTPSVPHITDSSISSGNSSSGQFSPHGSDQINEPTHLRLNIETVKMEKDTRASLMVRNIPNKYTQSMLLSELKEGGHGPGVIDFFYLPIDFRNKCNRGYAFVNFVDFRDVVAFHEAYNGKHWKIFKSDKICDITYARIQGKAGMMKRFQNSALMEKDPEYRPLVFSSEGENKGETVDFTS